MNKRIETAIAENDWILVGRLLKSYALLDDVFMKRARFNFDVQKHEESVKRQKEALETALEIKKMLGLDEGKNRVTKKDPAVHLKMLDE